jgi:hypothetical protein
MNAALIIASDSGHTSWWIGLPVIAVVLIVRLGFWSRRRAGRRGNDGGGGGGRG